MIQLKTALQIAGIKESCRLLSSLLRELIPLVTPGVETLELDKWAINWIKKAGGKPAFLGYGPKQNPFPSALCISINQEVIHGIPSRRKIRAGELVSIDCGIDLAGYISDQAITLEVGAVSEAAHNLNTVTQECLRRGIAAAKTGDRLLQIARAIHGYATQHGYGVVHQFCGHGVGFAVHEDPQVPNNPKGANPRMAEGLVIAVEPMINQGTGDVNILKDGWTVVTADQKLSAHWEHTIAFFADSAEALTEDLFLAP